MIRPRAGVAVLLLAVHVLIVWAMEYLYGQLLDYASEDTARWEEFDDPKNISSPWLYTALIENLGVCSRYLSGSTHRGEWRCVRFQPCRPNLLLDCAGARRSPV